VIEHFVVLIGVLKGLREVTFTLFAVMRLLNQYVLLFCSVGYPPIIDSYLGTIWILPLLFFLSFFLLFLLFFFKKSSYWIPVTRQLMFLIFTNNHSLTRHSFCGSFTKHFFP
jgi:hypothetical protein